MNAIKFSICKDPQDPLEPIQSAVEAFTRAQHKPVELHAIPWQNYKQEMAAMGIYGQGVDLSQVGAPVVNDLVAMNSLYLFTEMELNSFGGMSAFAPVAWNRMQGVQAGNIYAMPWIVDPRAIIY